VDERTVMLEAAVELEASKEAPRKARAFLQDALRRGGRDDLLDVALLLVTEVVTNAVLHAGPPVCLRVTLHLDQLVVEVEDPDPTLPERRDRGRLAEGGRGLHLVEELADRYGAEQVGGNGKVVWFGLGPHPGPSPALRS
jgi:anti-sigma regulatory factor (Ser/Thr protein kinase)